MNASGELPILDGSYYDEAYYQPGGKSGYEMPFTWEVEEASSRKIAAFISQFKPDRVLDVGCAKGFCCRALMETGIEAWGCDISQWALDNCEKAVQGRLHYADVRHGLPYMDGEFSLVMTYATLEHVEPESVLTVLEELSRVAKKWIVIDVPVSMTDKNEPRGDPSHRLFAPVSYWVVALYQLGWLFDLSRSSQGDVQDCHSATMVFGRPRLDELS